MRLRSIRQRHSTHLPLAQEAIKQLGRIARNLTIQSLDQGYSLSLPTVIECSDIPDDVTEILHQMLLKIFLTYRKQNT